MNMVIIGASGHYGFALEALGLRPDLRLAAVAPGTPGEDVSRLLSADGSAEAVLYDDWKTMLERENADLAVVNPFFCDNAAISAACLERGLHVFTEKPLATTFSDLDRLEDAWKRSGRMLGGMFNLRFCPWFLTVRDAVDRGLIGEVRQIQGRKSYKLGRRGEVYQRRALYGGIIPWVGIHALDWVLQLGGPCRCVSAAQSDACNRGNGELEMTSAVMTVSRRGVIGTVTADFLRPDGAPRHDDDRLRVTGTKGMLEALNGEVYIEDDQPRRLLPTVGGQNCLCAMLDAINTPAARQRTLDDLDVTRTALTAREAGDQEKVLFCG